MTKKRVLRSRGSKEEEGRDRRLFDKEFQSVILFRVFIQFVGTFVERFFDNDTKHKLLTFSNICIF